MKKLVCLLLALVLAFSMVACGKDGGQEQQGASIKKTVLVDEADVKITAVSLTERDLVGPELKLELQNKTDKNLIFQVHSTTINNYMVNGVMSVEVPAGEEVSHTMIFSTTELQTCGITTVAKLELGFRAYDAKSWSLYLNTKPITLNTDAAEGFNFTYQHEGTTLHADHGVKILAKSPITQGDLQVYIYNGSEVNIALETAQCLINGVEVDPQFYVEMLVGKHLVTELIFPEELLEENNLEKIENIQVVFRILNADTGEEIAQTEAVALTVQE